MIYFKLLCNNKSFISFIRQISTSCKYNTHYDVLKLPRDCSYTDIRNSYLKLSKQYHPDRNKDANSHKEFVKISEAYNTLSKSSSRRDYDLGLSNSYGNIDIHVRTTRTEPWTDETFWEHRDRSKDAYYKSQPYYGIKGIKKISNIWIVLLCIGFTSIGVILQILAIRRSFTLNRSEMEKHSLELEQLHSEIRAKAMANGNEKQLKLLIEKFKSENRQKQ